MAGEYLHTNDAPGAIGPYSQATKAGGFLFTPDTLRIILHQNQPLEVKQFPVIPVPPGLAQGVPTVRPTIAPTTGPVFVSSPTPAQIGRAHV